MWVRLRLDIGWPDLLSGFAYCVMPGKRLTAVHATARSWSRQEDFLITLSVRSAFDLTLRALQLPCGSEVLLSALTVPDMVRIVRLHGLVPVPVDTDDAGNISIRSLRRAISPKTRMIVVAHLFGGLVLLDEVLQIARERAVLVVEDCAQGFRRVGDSGHPASDIAMFSFGPIKTATAVGGGVIRVSSPALRERIAEILKNDPVQSHFAFARRLVRFSVLKLLSGRRCASLFRRCVESLGYDFDLIAGTAARGFASFDLLSQIRRQPSAPLLRLLRRRWRSYDFARVERRVCMGRYLDKRIGLEHAESHSYWVYPLFVHDPTVVRDRLRAAGFDAICQSRMTVVPAIDDSRLPTLARLKWNQVVFLPWYPEMPDRAMDEMANIVGYSNVVTDCHPERQNNTMHAEPPTARVSN